MKKGTWSHFSLDLMSKKTKLKALGTRFHSCEKYENGNKRNSRSFNLCLETTTNDPNNTLNLFHGFTSLKKRSSVLDKTFFMV